MAVTASDTKPNLLDKQKTNSFGNLDVLILISKISTENMLR